MFVLICIAGKIPSRSTPQPNGGLMQSNTWIGGQYSQIGPPSQVAPQLPNNAMLNQHAGTLNNLCQYRTLNRGAQPPQSAHFTFYNGTYYNTKTSNWQTPTIPHQAGSYQQQARAETNNYYQKVFHDKQQSLSINTQNGNPPVTSGLQIATQQDFHRGSLRPHNTIKANTFYPQQDMPAHLIQSQWTQDANVVSANGHCNKLKGMLLNENGQSTELVSPCATTATSLPSYNMAKRNSWSTKTSSAQILQVSSEKFQKTQYPGQLDPTHNSAEEAKHQVIARIADELRRSVPATSDGCPPVYTSSLYNGNQCANEVWSLEPSKFSVSKNYNLNASQTVSLSKTSLGKPNHHVISRTQQSVEAPQPSSVPNQVFNVTAPRDCHWEIRQRNNKGVKVADAKDNPVGLIGAASRFRKLTKSTSQNINETIPSVANNNEIHEIVTSVKGNDGSIHASPGRTGARAVAVVQPLSQDSYQAASKCISSERISPLADKSVINHSAVSSENSLVSSSGSAGHLDVSQKLFGAVDTGLERTNKTQVDQHVASTAQNLVTNDVPISVDVDKSQNPTTVVELSLAPTIPWTMDALYRLMLDEEKAQLKLSKDLAHSSSSKLLSMFWDGDTKNLLCKLKKGWYKDLVTDVASFHSKEVTSDCVILSQVKSSFEKQFQSYHVLKDDEVYSVPPYKSPWLNINEQLDDIDKEFGFPWSLKRHSHVLKNRSEPDQIWTVSSTPAKIASEVPNEVLPQMELGSDEEKQPSPVEVTSTQVASPNESDASDPYYSFQIHVLPPEEAKIMFERVQRNMQQSMDTDIQPLGVTGSSVEAVDVALNDSKRMKKSVCPIEEVCCISKWMEQICVPGTPLSKCQCKNGRSPTGSTDNPLNKEVMSVNGHDGLRVIMSDSRFFTGENQLTVEENVNNQIMRCSQSEPCSELGQLIASTENNHKFNCPDKEPNNISQRSPNSNPCIILKSEKDGDLSNGETEIRLDPEADCVQGQIKSTEVTQPCNSVSCDIETPPSSGREVANQVMEENCEPAQTKAMDVALQSSLETEKQTKSSEMAAIQETLILGSKCETVERKHKRLGSHDEFFPIFKKPNKCKPSGDVDSKPSTNSKVLVDPDEHETLATNVRVVQLVLFGSASQNKCGLTDSRKRRVSSPGVGSDGELKPPEVLAVKLSPLRRKSSESLPKLERSVKQRVYEKWRSFIMTLPGHKRKQKTQKCASGSLSGASLKRASVVGSTNTKKPPVSSDLSIRNWKRNASRCMSLKRKTPFSDQPGQGKEKMQRSAFTADHRSRFENKSHVVKPIQETSVLKFSVLPTTFNFQDGSNQGKETEDPVPSKLWY